MNTEKSWTIVQFDDFSVAAVPTNWIQGDFCHWQSYLQSKLNNAIRKCEALNTCWPTHRIKIFRNATFEDYMTARGKAKIAEETSDLASECENSSKRKRIQKLLSSSDESIDESLLPPAPKLGKITKSKEIIPQNVCVENNMRKPQPENIFNRNDPDIERSVLEENYNENVVSHQTSQSNTSCVCCEKYLRIILEQNHLLRGISSDILSEVRLLRENKRYQENQDDVQSVFVKYANQITFPIQTESDMEKFEGILNDQENFTKAVKEFAGFGGSNTYSFIKRVMTSVITNDIAKTYSWLGRKGKKKFSDLNIAKLMLRAAEKANISENFSKTETAIQSWLKRATERQQQQQQQNRQTKKF